MIGSDYMGEIVTGKVISRNFGTISHLPGSKMIDNGDKLIGSQEIEWLTSRRKNPVTDVVIITEKIDGMNAGVLKKNGSLYPIMRAGYDVRTSHVEWVRGFAKFVEDHQDRFYNLLVDGERVCGEWMLKTHTLHYDLSHEPFVAFDIINENGIRCQYTKFVDRVKKFAFTTPGVVHIGESMPTDMAMSLLGIGYHHVTDGEPEGVVYRYESNGRFVAYGKFVSNQKLGNEKLFNDNISSDTINYTSRRLVDRYQIYMR